MIQFFRMFFLVMDSTTSIQMCPIFVLLEKIATVKMVETNRVLSGVNESY